MSTLLDFEKPILELEGKVKELRSLAAGSELDIAEEVARLEGRAAKLLSQTYAKLTAWQKTQVARHPERPKALAYVAQLVTDWTPLSGDRAFGEDAVATNPGGRRRRGKLSPKRSCSPPAFPQNTRPNRPQAGQEGSMRAGVGRAARLVLPAAAAG